MGLRPPRRFQTPKAGNRPDECEDADITVYPYGGGPARIALSDGASESAFARSWARILANAFVWRPLDLACLDEDSLTVWLGECAEEWNKSVPWERIPWHGEAKARAGAMATLLGMTIEQSPSRPGVYSYQALAVGDCCLFVVRDGSLDLSFPLQHSGEFNNTPSLICSNTANNRGVWARTHPLQGQCLPGDTLILASDAVACWLLQENESGGKPWETLLALSSDSERESWSLARRREGVMPNDDVTWVSIQVE